MSRFQAFIDTNLENDEIEALKKKLEETQKAMQLIMAQVNKVSTEVNHPHENASDISTISSSIYKGPSENQILADNEASQVTNLSHNNQAQKSTIAEQNMNERIPKEETYNLEHTNCSKDEVSNTPLENFTASHARTHVSEIEEIEDNGETKFEENFGDHNEHSESDSGIQQHYESMDFTSQNMYQDETGYSYYYEDVHYDEEDDSDSDEELDEYSHAGNQVQDIHPYSSYNQYANDQAEGIYNSQEPTDISSHGFDREIDEESSCQLTREDIEDLQNYVGENVKVCLIYLNLHIKHLSFFLDNLIFYDKF